VEDLLDRYDATDLRGTSVLVVFLFIPTYSFLSVLFYVFLHIYISLFPVCFCAACIMRNKKMMIMMMMMMITD